jgi:hypothetical protein
MLSEDYTNTYKAKTHLTHDFSLAYDVANSLPLFFLTRSLQRQSEFNTENFFPHTCETRHQPHQMVELQPDADESKSARPLLHTLILGESRLCSRHSC